MQIGSVTDILVGIDAVVSVCLVECAGTFVEPRTDLTSPIKEVAEPVVLAAVIVNGFLDAAGDRDFVIQVYDFLCALDHPGQNTFACVLIEVIAILSSGALTDFCLNLLRILMRNLECSVCIGSDSCNAVFLSDNDDLAVLALVANTLVIEILNLFHTVLLSVETISSA